MRYPFSSAPATERRSGMVLLVVMAMLSLFATTALAFVFFADSEAVGSQYHRESLVQTQSDVDQEVLAAHFLSQLIYGTDNVYSSMRGWDLARSMYGYNPAVLNYTPYNGVGRDALRDGGTPDNFNYINYMMYDATPGDPINGKQRNPEWFGKAGDANFRYVGGANPPWTAYDTSSLFLAQVTADGTVLMPSFSRPWIGNGGNASASKYVSLSPDPAWNTYSGVSAWPPPDTDASGNHVKNLEFGPTGNDSRWIDPGFPILTAPNGKRYRALVAPLVMDLSNRLHLWAHGNRIGNGNQVSAVGMGPTEVNLALLPGINAAELQLLFDSKYGGTFYGTAAAWNAAPQRNFPNWTYGGAVGATTSLPAGNALGMPRVGPWYAPFELDGLATNTSPNPVAMPAPGSYLPFPTYPIPGYENTGGETANKPLGFNFVNPTGLNIKPFPMSHMR